MFGEGPNIVAIPPMAQNIERGWEQPLIKSMLDQFASFSTYVHFDKRGTGVSGRRSLMPGIDERVEDLEAVMNAAGMESAHLFACSDGGPMAVMFAATYPERVRSIVFHGSYAARAPVDMTEERIAANKEFFRDFASKWGTPDSPMVDLFAPSLSDDSEFRAWHEGYERSAADQDSLIDLFDLTLEVDTRELLPKVDVPVLVLHRTDELVVPVDLGRELADGITGAELVEVSGRDHFQYVGDVNEWMDVLQQFVTGTVTKRDAGAKSVRVETLGRFAVLVNGDEVPVSDWGSRHARQILKRLVAARGWPVTREQLIEMCWPEETDLRRLSARLSVQLSAIRRVLGGGVIADRSSVRLDVDKIATDLEEVFDADDSEVVSIYRGDFLPDDVYEDWSSPTRAAVRAHFVKAAHRSADGADADLREQLGRQLVEADPYDEAGHRLLIDALEDLGRPGLAEQARANLETVLSEI